MIVDVVLSSLTSCRHVGSHRSLHTQFSGIGNVDCQRSASLVLLTSASRVLVFVLRSIFLISGSELRPRSSVFRWDWAIMVLRCLVDPVHARLQDVLFARLRAQWFLALVLMGADGHGCGETSKMLLHGRYGVEANPKLELRNSLCDGALCNLNSIIPRPVGRDPTFSCGAEHTKNGIDITMSAGRALPKKFFKHVSSVVFETGKLSCGVRSTFFSSHLLDTVTFFDYCVANHLLTHLVVVL